MHKLMEYICKELEELERKADKDGKLSMAEIEYADKLTHMKKNILKSEEMWNDSEYSMDSPYMGNIGSYARGGRVGGNRSRGANQYGSYARGGYPREGYSMDGDFRMEIESLIEDAPNERIKHKMRELIKEM